jgi:hypothetical protein
MAQELEALPKTPLPQAVTLDAAALDERHCIL